MSRKKIYSLFWDRAACGELNLAAEASAILRGEENKELPGIEETVQEYEQVKVRLIKIIDQEGEKTLGRPQGSYLTFETHKIGGDKNFSAQLSAIIARHLQPLLPKRSGNQPFLLVGLGNKDAIPDALGPHVIEHTMATRHLYRYAPQEIADTMLPICAVAPGVLGNTGIETAEFIHCLADLTKPAAIIAIDSLAAANLERVGTSIQISDSGINPGAGVGNQRMVINKASIGVPVIAIGVPTVVDSCAIIAESLAILWQNKQKPDDELSEDDIKAVKDEMLQNFAGSLIVTPKDIDNLIADLSYMLAGAIAQAIHPGVNRDNFRDYLN